MAATVPMPTLKAIDEEVNYAEFVIAWNVKMLLTAQGKSQSSLAAAMGIQRATMTNKMKGRIAWSVADLVRAAAFLDTTTNALMDDGLLKQLQGLGNKKALGEPKASNELPQLGLNQRHFDYQFIYKAGNEADFVLWEKEITESSEVVTDQQ